MRLAGEGKKKPGSDGSGHRPHGAVSQVPSDANCLTHLSAAPRAAFFFFSFFLLSHCLLFSSVKREMLSIARRSYRDASA